jgi:hypothetical protein
VGDVDPAGLASVGLTFGTKPEVDIEEDEREIARFMGLLSL